VRGGCSKRGTAAAAAAAEQQHGKAIAARQRRAKGLSECKLNQIYPVDVTAFSS
jgi:hypothetical protein